MYMVVFDSVDFQNFSWPGLPCCIFLIFCFLLVEFLYFFQKQNFSLRGKTKRTTAKNVLVVALTNPQAGPQEGSP